jgi:hypothetical protein
MATIDQIKKHYDKLTARERFALITAAAIRNDTAEESALINSAPVINWEYPHTIGLTYGFKQLVKYHVSQQLGTAGTFFMLMHLWQNEASTPILEAIEAEELTNGETALSITARRFLEGKKAFETVCREYDVDPQAMEDSYNPAPMLTFMMDNTQRLGFADGVELTDLEKTTNEYRALIEQSREHWAEGKASHDTYNHKKNPYGRR